MKKILTLLAMAFVTMGTWADDTWTVAGSCNLFDSEWDVNNNDNNMTYQGENTHTWRWQKTNVVLCSGRTYSFKVVKNHSYDESYPGSNYELNSTHFSETGLYTVTIDFYDDSHDFGVTCTKTGDVDGVYNVAGASAMMGSDWKPWDTKNQMTLQGDGTYQLVKEQVTLSNGSYDYKVCKDHNWYDAGGGTGTKDNASLSVNYSGTLDVKYDITFTIDPSTSPTNTVTASAVKKAYNITLSENEDVATKIAETCQVGDNSITVNRTLHAGHWNTICLPFFMSWDNLQATFGSGWKLAEFTGCTNNTMTFNQVYAADHNKPYLLWVPEAKGDMSTFTVTYDYINHDNDRLTVNPNGAGYKMIGTLAPIDALGSGNLFIANDKVYKSTGISKMKAMSAYFEVPDGAPARSFTFSVDGETTGIVSIDQDGCMNVNENLFDLQGRRVAPTKHGLYIVKGKKVIK